MRLPAGPLRLAAWASAMLVCVPACELAAPIPRRTSPRPTVFEAFPAPGARLVAIDADHRAWAYEIGATLEVHDEDGLIGAARASAWVLLDAAPDRSAAVCPGREVTLLESGAAETTSVADLVATVETMRCEGLATRGAGDAWIVIAQDPSVGRVGFEPVRSQLCGHAPEGWTCRELGDPPRVGTLVLSPTHAWWIASGHLVALDTSVGDGEPFVVAASVGSGSLQPSAHEDAVLFVPSREAAEQSPRRIALDGTETSLVAASEHDAYEDVWMTADDRVLAIDVARDGSTHCSPGVLGLSGSCSTTWRWTQLVVFELGSGEPLELAHVDYRSGGERPAGIERTSGTFVAGDQWYGLP